MGRSGYGRHSFLNEYIRENEVKKIMEIGVKNGENAKNMVGEAIKDFAPEEVKYFGFDTFDGDKKKRTEEKLSETGCGFELFEGDSKETLPEKVNILPKMDLIFIDGGHGYEVVKSDWENSKKLIHSDTAVFFHNYDFSGPGRVVDEISVRDFTVEILDPESDYRTAFVAPK